MFDTGAQKLMIGQYGWEIIKRHDTWICAHGVKMGGPPKSGHLLQLVDSRGVVKTFLYGKRDLVILCKDLFNTNPDENLLE